MVQTSLKSKLKEFPLIRKFNDSPMLQKRCYYGTSGAGVVGPKLNSYIHVFNSFGFLTGDENRYPFSVELFSDALDKKLDFRLGFNESKIVDIGEHFAGDQLGFVGFRLNHELPNEDFLPYCFTTVIKDGEACSNVHSSSFGTSGFAEMTTTYPDYMFSRKQIASSYMILVTLYRYGRYSTNHYTIDIENLDDSSEKFSITKSFQGSICSIDLSAAAEHFSENGRLNVTISGPSHANPYFFVNNKTLFHF